ncbi:hypothetical protein EDB80DRAFT_830437 [Ilyonectria destructans]|nr:hypothetical protein EDB80DRAFT_830437 [Ilyonectria destructans]
MSDSTAFLARLELCIDPEARLLICCRQECRFALSVARSRATTHLKDKHQVHEDERKGLTRVLKDLGESYFHDPTEAQPLDDGSPEHPHLRVYKGFVCRTYNTRTTNFSLLRRHISSTHLYDKHSTRRELDELYDDIWLQTWTAGSNRTRKYWIIKHKGSLLRVNDDIQAHLQSVEECERS